MYLEYLIGDLFNIILWKSLTAWVMKVRLNVSILFGNIFGYIIRKKGR